MKPERNPRRAYNAEGREIEPMTLGQMRDMRVRSLSVYCNRCSYSATVKCDALPDYMPVHDVTLMLRCSQCGSNYLSAHINVSELYARW